MRIRVHSMILKRRFVRLYAVMRNASKILKILYFWGKLYRNCEYFLKFLTCRNKDFMVRLKCMKNYNYIDLLLEALKEADPYRIILFGSCANGTTNESSDIDIMVILDNNDVAKTYEERINKKLFINRLVRDINYKVPLDILVYSKEEYNIVKNVGNYFIDEIESTGRVIYEKAS